MKKTQKNPHSLSSPTRIQQTDARGDQNPPLTFCWKSLPPFNKHGETPFLMMINLTIQNGGSETKL